MSYANYTMYIQLEGQYRAQEMFKQAEFDALRFSRSLLSIGGNVAQVINYMAMLQNATWNITDAQQAYDEAVVRSGRGSEEAVRAYQRLTRASHQAQMAQIGFYLGVANTTIALLAQAKTVIGLVSGLNFLTVITKIQTAVDVIHTAVLWAKAHAVSILTFGLAAIAGTATILAAQGATGGGGGGTTMPTTTTSPAGGETKVFHIVQDFSMKKGEDFDSFWERTGRTSKAEWGATG